VDENKLKVFLLGFDPNLLNSVSQRVNKQRPVEVRTFTDLNEFLAESTEHSPELVGVSVSFPHQKVSQFPSIFKAALSVPVILFGENQSFKTTRALSSLNADFKIQGVLTAHNLWMKIVNYQKMKEEELSSRDRDPTKKAELANESIFLKDRGEKDSTHKNSILNSVISALNDDSKTRESEYNMNILSSQSEPNSASTPAGGIAGETKSGVSASSFGMNSADNSPSVASNGTRPSASGKNAHNFAHVTGEDSQRAQQSNQDAPRENFKTSQIGNRLGEVPKPQEDSSSLKTKNDQADSSQKGRGKRQGQSHNSGSLNKGELSQNNNSSLNPGEGQFGKVQLADENEIRKDQAKKAKDKSHREQAQLRTILEICSDMALQKVFSSKKENQKSEIDIQKITVYSIEIGKIKGYLLLASYPDSGTEAQNSAFKVALIEALKEHGASGHISEPYQLNLEVEGYMSSVSDFSEFSIGQEGREGQFYSVSFVEREVTLPTLTDSDKPDMYFVDIRVIPPKTPVNFDAFLYLPKNQRFVRYLKEGRSLSLKQAKRHTEEDEGQNQLYLPKKQKKLFESYFIKNTLNWEFELNRKNKAS
jgi:hypothetical protein